MMSDAALMLHSPDGLARTDRDYCASLLRAGSKSFSLASWLLPARVRHQATAFYAFCRVADDAIDDSREPERALTELHRRVEAVYRGGTLDDPIDRALCWVVHTSQIPRALIDALLEGFAWDLQECRYETLEQTLAYSARVASVVGVIMTLIMGERERSTLARACDLGAAMQLTNIARDVGEDARRGRLYVPADWLRNEGIDPDAFIRTPTAEPGVGRAVERLLMEAATLYERSRAGIPALPHDCQPAILAATLLYSDIGRMVARRNYDSVSGRAYTSVWRKLQLLCRVWLSPKVALDRVAWAQPPLAETAFLVDAVEPAV